MAVIVVVRTVDRSDHSGDARAGDVLDTFPDTQVFRPHELANPDWRMFKVALTETECEALTNPERLPPTAPRGTLVQKRTWHVDLKVLPAELKAHVDDDKRVVPIFDATSPAHLAIFRAAVRQRKASV